MSGIQLNIVKGISFWALFLILLLIKSCTLPNTWGRGDDEEVGAYFDVANLTVQPDTALMGVDTVLVTVNMRFINHPVTNEEFDESVLKYTWSDRYLIEEDKGKTNSRTARYFIPNDTTEYLPIDIKSVSISVTVRDTIADVVDWRIKNIYLKRE
jgi:hypothetical protein